MLCYGTEWYGTNSSYTPKPMGEIEISLGKYLPQPRVLLLQHLNLVAC